MLNRTVIMGRFTADPELRRTQQGTPHVSFSLAVERDFKEQSGERKADFIPCVAWRGTAELIAKYFKKGRTAVAEGRLQTRDWKAEDGSPRRTTEILVDNIYFADSKKGDTAGTAEPPALEEIPDDDGHLPF